MWIFTNWESQKGLGCALFSLNKDEFVQLWKDLLIFYFRETTFY